MRLEIGLLVIEIMVLEIIMATIRKAIVRWHIRICDGSLNGLTLLTMALIKTFTEITSWLPESKILIARLHSYLDDLQEFNEPLIMDT